MEIKILLYITLGIVTGIVLNSIKKRKNIIYRAPSSNLIRRKVFYDENGKSVKLVPKVHICPIVESMKK